MRRFSRFALVLGRFAAAQVAHAQIVIEDFAHFFKQRVVELGQAFGDVFVYGRFADVKPLCGFAHGAMSFGNVLAEFDCARILTVVHNHSPILCGCIMYERIRPNMTMFVRRRAVRRDSRGQKLKARRARSCQNT